MAVDPGDIGGAAPVAAVAEVVSPESSNTARVGAKVMAATGGSALGSAIATILNWYLDSHHILGQNPIPPPVQGAIALVIASLVAFVGGWATPQL